MIGGGPAGLMAAERLSRAGLVVTVYERMPTVGRKLMMAGVGGLNITHSEPFARFVRRYRAEGEWLPPILEVFPPQALRDWCADLGEPCFVGSSGRVFPQSFKASPLLRAWLLRLGSLGVEIRTRHRWRGWHDDALVFETPDGSVEMSADATVLALGGASWPRLGTDGGWVGVLEREGADVAPLRPANCAVHIDWSDGFRERFAGTPLKSIALSRGSETGAGEAMVTSRGLEGGSVYALTPCVREALNTGGEAILTIDLKPGVSAATHAERLRRGRSGDSLANRLRKAARLPPVAIALVRESSNAVPSEASALAASFKSLPLRVTGLGALDRAISTAGGVAASAVDERRMLNCRKGVFVAGEMLDWEAPTGGYLMQASFATGAAAAEGVLSWIGRSGS